MDITLLAGSKVCYRHVLEDLFVSVIVMFWA